MLTVLRHLMKNEKGATALYGHWRSTDGMTAGSTAVA